jgi:hypothetical protein
MNSAATDASRLVRMTTFPSGRQQSFAARCHERGKPREVMIQTVTDAIFTRSGDVLQRFLYQP